MQNMFCGCTSLITIELSSFNIHKVNDMKYMFERCSSLSTLDLSSFSTQNLRNMCGMFTNCFSLIKVDLSTFNTSNAFVIGIFCGCNKLSKYCSSDKNIITQFNKKSDFSMK